MLPSSDLSNPAPAPARARIARRVATALLLGSSLLAATQVAPVASAATSTTTLAPPTPAATPLPDWAARPARTVTIPSSIDASGATDVSSPMRAFLDSVPDGSVIAFPKGATYRMEQRLLVKNRNRLFFDGNGAMVFMTTPGEATRGNIRIEGGSSIVINNLVVKGANPAGGRDGTFDLSKEHQHGIDFRSTKGAAVIGSTVTDTYGDFVYFGALDTKHPWAENGLVRNSRFERSGRQGITVTGGRNIVVEHNAIADLRRATFDFEPGGTPHGADGITIRNNEVGRGRLMFVAAAGKGRVDNVTVENNRLKGQAMQFFVIDKAGGIRRNWRVTGNTSDLAFGAPHQSPMRFTRVHGLTISGNVQPMKPNRDMFIARTWDACGVAVSGNTITNAIGQVQVNGVCTK